MNAIHKNANVAQGFRPGSKIKIDGQQTLTKLKQGFIPLTFFLWPAVYV